MITIDQVYPIIYAAMDEINQALPVERRLVKLPQTPIDDGTGVIDSLGMTMLIVAIEQKIEITFGINISLAAEHFRPESKTIFKTVESLCQHITSLLHQSYVR